MRYAFFSHKENLSTMTVNHNFFSLMTVLGALTNVKARETVAIDLKACMRYAVEHSTKMRIAHADNRDAQIDRRDAILAAFTPEIEGNTYALFETVNLLKDKIEAKGKKREEAIMLLNHKAALKAIVEQRAYFKELSLARMEDVHSVLIEELGVERNLRHIRVGISGTRYRPLEVESQIREAVEDMCALVNGKSDPYEKALLALLLIAYIQPFTDGNKRTSRLMANSLLISRSLCPLSFRTVEANDYRAALLLFYEQNNISAFKKMFLEQIEFAMKEYF
jgi:Fic family protein